MYPAVVNEESEQFVARRHCEVVEDGQKATANGETVST